MMYDLNTNDNNVEIDGVPFFAKEIRSIEAFPRRDLKRTKIKGGTEYVTRGEYIPREYSFTTSVDVPADKPDIHDSLFLQLCNKPCEVICPDMGGMFMAEVTIRKTHPEGSPTSIDLEINVKEIPTVSLIPNDELVKPQTEIVMDKNEDIGVN